MFSIKMKNKKIDGKYVILLLLTIGVIVVLSVMFFRQKTDDEIRSYEQIRQSGELRIAINYPPDKQEHDAVSKLQYELIKTICDSLHLKPVFIVENVFEKTIDALQRGEIDMIGNAIPVTSEMMLQVIFSVPIFQSKLVLIQQAADSDNDRYPLRDLFELSKKTIRIQSNSPHKLRINNLSEEIGDTIYIVEMQNCSIDSLIRKVAEGEIDFTVCDNLSAASAKEHYPNIDIETALGFPQIKAWAFNAKSTELQDAINFYIEKLLKTK